VPNPIQVEALKKSYGPLAAVKGIDFQVSAGEVFGLLGPNGAGKTTTVEILEGLRPRSAGRVSVLDCDPEVQTLRLKDRVGVCLQSTRLPDKMKVREAMDLFGALYTRTVDASQLLKRLQLWRSANLSTRSSRAGRNSASRWPWRCSTIPRCCSWMSLRAGSTRRRAWKSTNWCRTPPRAAHHPAHHALHRRGGEVV